MLVQTGFEKVLNLREYLINIGCQLDFQSGALLNGFLPKAPQGLKIPGKEEVSLSLIGGALKKMMPKFKVRRYGCKTLGKLYEKLDRYELVST